MGLILVDDVQRVSEEIKVSVAVDEESQGPLRLEE